MNIDEQLYSRQIAALGLGTMNKICKLKVLVYGLRGLGLEISKNIILVGPEKVSLFDNKKIKIEDLCSNFYVEEKDIGLRRDEVCLKKLSDLNPFVKCDILKDKKIENYIKDYDIIVISEIMEIDRLIKINEICRENKKGFIYTLVFGLFFFCFVDFGDHIITNINNKEKKKYYIKDIIKGKNTLILIDNSIEDFDINEDEYVIFKEINGLSQLSNGKKRKIKNCELNSFEIEEDSSNYNDYIDGGIVEEVKENILIHNKSFKEMLNLPDICEENNPKIKYINMHIAFLSLHEYFQISKNLPKNNEELTNVLKIAKKIYEKNKDKWSNKININEDYLEDIFKYSKCLISPICGYGGGVASQEIIKFTGIFQPINQWFRADFSGILDKNFIHDNIITNYSRYDEQIMIFGQETQKNLENLNIFIIGAGAVGCELLKYFAMMGISTNSSSLLTITDNDRIEKSNLNRQFLFRNNDILKFKSQCAIEAVKKMNSKMNCKYYTELVWKDTEKIFNDSFYKKQNALVIAVDNFEARNYISKIGEKYKIPYFNCGTDGPYANVDAFIPGVTVEGSYPTNYQKIVPNCTLKMFPSSINHCVLWSVSIFKKYFKENIKYMNILKKNFKNYLELMDKFSDLRKKFHKIKKNFKLFKIAYSKNFNKCIKYSIDKYIKLFIDNINKLIECYPQDYINSDTGKKFWNGNKRFPHPLEFNIKDEMCFHFIKSFSCIMAYCFNIDISKLNVDNCIINYYENIYKKKNKKNESFETKIYYENQIKGLENKINLFFKNNNINDNEFNEIDFEKDTTNINEINFIYYSSNLRAKNYNINQEDKIKIKIIAGKIIPSLITSTSSIAGLLALQIYVICQKKNHRNFRTGIIDLSDNTLALGIPESIK